MIHLHDLHGTRSLMFLACETSEFLTFTAHEGGKVEIRCPYEAKYEEHKKYLCRGECPRVFKDKPVESESAAKDERFSLTDNKTAHIFTVTITDLRTEDKGQYWCGVKTGLFNHDYKREIYLEIKHDIISHFILCLVTQKTKSYVLSIEVVKILNTYHWSHISLKRH
uniref:Immunoglobulin domain-containing protein n=1 Tax=Cyprinus carpio carpio TaxID=630221 RepID=A0A9J8C9G8_CYPCA